MITVINRPQSHRTSSLEVLLDVSVKDFDHPSVELKALLNECKTTKRKVGCVLHQYAPSVFFSYDLNNQGQYEVALVAALCTPANEVHVTQGGEVESWPKY